MNQLFLALIEDNDINDPLRQRGNPAVGSGMCAARWIYDVSKIGDFMKAGWHVYRVNGFQRVIDVTIELKMEQKDGSTESSQSN